ncbi:MAG: 50S ribosomal protein L10 [Candidatus Bostrichicola ureolyticus]|nr:MAG: 50S ribosomal protein L10 [Candidatus Bostrichicola ureolyticus]
MTKEQKYKNIEALVSWLSSNNAIYLTDISGLNAQQISIFRNECFKFKVKTKTIKNSLFKKALEFNKNKEFDPFYDILKGNTTISISNINNLPAKIIKNFRIKTGINNKPIIKGVYIDKCFYIGNNHLETLIRIKSKEELIYEIFKLLNFTIINLISTLKVNNNIFNILHSLQINNKINKLN